MVRSISRIVLLCGLLTPAATAGGCQRGPTWNLAPVEGTVIKGGRPLRGIEVVFLSDADTQGPRSSGITDEAGRYRLRTDNGDDGAMTGKYRVVVLDLRAALIRMRRSGRGTQGNKAGQLPPEVVKRLEELEKSGANTPQVPSSYGHFNDTPLRAEVRPGPQTLDFDLP